MGALSLNMSRQLATASAFIVIFFITCIYAIDMEPLPSDEIVPQTPERAHAQTLDEIANLNSKLSQRDRLIVQQREEIDNLRKKMIHRDGVIAQLQKHVQPMQQEGQEGKANVDVLSNMGEFVQAHSSVAFGGFIPLAGVANFLPSATGPSASMGVSSERDAKAQEVLFGFGSRRRKKTPPPPPADLLPWKSDYPAGGAINDITSQCKVWWNGKNGPAKLGQKAAGLAHKNNFRQESKQYKLTSHAGKGNAGNWIVGVKTGCAVVTDKKKDENRICGCYEIWCPWEAWNDQNLGTKKCSTVRQMFGCFDEKDVWLADCKKVHGSITKRRALPEVILF